MIRQPATVVPTTLWARRYSLRKRGRTPPAPVSAASTPIAVLRVTHTASGGLSFRSLFLCGRNSHAESAMANAIKTSSRIAVLRCVARSAPAAAPAMDPGPSRINAAQSMERLTACA